MNRFLLLALISGLLSPIAARTESYWLVYGFFIHGSSIGQIETASMEDCIEQGERWKSEGKKEFKVRGGLHYICLKGK